MPVSRTNGASIVALSDAADLTDKSLKRVGGLELVEEDNAVSAPNPDGITLERRPCWHSLLSSSPIYWSRAGGLVHVSRSPLEGRHVGGPVSPAAFIDHIPAAAISVNPSSPAILRGLMYTTYVRDNPPVTDLDRNTLVEATKMWISRSDRGLPENFDTTQPDAVCTRHYVGLHYVHVAASNKPESPASKKRKRAGRPRGPNIQCSHGAQMYRES
ncbi:hypothetical protein B0H10DRAFT_2213372 [Mycena sp. CBHHK59/15]|nr:hypothetical protein B0H10DRAFT_2213372 [Mycena sp. CBHHK59/15]